MTRFVADGGHPGAEVFTDIAALDDGVFEARDELCGREDEAFSCARSNGKRPPLLRQVLGLAPATPRRSFAADRPKVDQ
ncbi:MAG TPA: hypothetical protein VHY82_05935 [Acetobacteraceae bacterium]|jgi:hypothetical protein|nr:hypothetical protein [Acetobacteraceae bacterium]